MANNEIKVTIALYGKIDSNIDKWWEWFLFSKEIIKKIGYVSNYIGVISKTFKSGKVTTMSRTEKKLKKVLDNNESLDSLGVFSLPIGFKQAVFDYDVHIARTKTLHAQHISLSMNKVTYEKLDNIKNIIVDLKKYIDFEYGEIFELDVSECPFLYVSKANEPSFYKSLKIIKII